MKLWIDDVRPAPDGYVWCKSVNQAKVHIQNALLADSIHDALFGNSERPPMHYITLIDIDHDAGEYAKDGGDYIKLLDWMEEIGYIPYKIHIHSMNPVGVENMRRIIRKNGWREV